MSKLKDEKKSLISIITVVITHHPRFYPGVLGVRILRAVVIATCGTHGKDRSWPCQTSHPAVYIRRLVHSKLSPLCTVSYINTTNIKEICFYIFNIQNYYTDQKSTKAVWKFVNLVTLLSKTLNFCFVFIHCLLDSNFFFLCY